ncbi:MAG: alpha/beta hydrolase, partial [Beijerinckiaceae bacterium]|nr:alpha/beta hydrolase [Beijerinckiaceae bacterium]
FQHGVLVGHSDGASIAAIYAGTFNDPRLKGISLMAPHFFVEDISLRSIQQAKIAYETTDLRDKLARWHDHVDVAFSGWNDAWCNPGFRNWDVTGCLPNIKIPVQIIQGADDQYGTTRQLEVAAETCKVPVETVLLEGIKHSPWRETPDETCKLISGFCEKVLGSRAGAG